MANLKASNPQPRLMDYIQVGAVLSAFTVLLLLIPQYVEPSSLPPHQLIQPLLGAVVLTGVVWLTMVVARNFFILKGAVIAEYYVDYSQNTPPEWIERPARTFNNLLQVPLLFYVVCLLIIVTDSLDQVSLVFAWIFVATRVVHAAIYILVNNVKYRFTAWMTGCITLIFLWVEVWRLAY